MKYTQHFEDNKLVWKARDFTFADLANDVAAMTEQKRYEEHLNMMEPIWLERHHKYKWSVELELLLRCGEIYCSKCEESHPRMKGRLQVMPAMAGPPKDHQTVTVLMASGYCMNCKNFLYAIIDPRKFINPDEWVQKHGEDEFTVENWLKGNLVRKRPTGYRLLVMKTVLPHQKEAAELLRQQLMKEPVTASTIPDLLL